jgi:hypothetical protein
MREAFERHRVAAMDLPGDRVGETDKLAHRPSIILCPAAARKRRVTAVRRTRREKRAECRQACVYRPAKPLTGMLDWGPF